MGSTQFGRTHFYYQEEETVYPGNRKLLPLAVDVAPHRRWSGTTGFACGAPQNIPTSRSEIAGYLDISFIFSPFPIF
jgi:hypothetical protein